VPVIQQRHLSLQHESPKAKSPADLIATPLAEVYRAWRALAGRRFAPERREISPARFKAVLKSAFLLDVIDGGADFRLALGGERIMRFFAGRVAPGGLLSQVAGSLFYERATGAFRYCITTRAPFAAGPSPGVLDGREHLTLESLVLPLSDDGTTVTGLFGAVHIEPSARTALAATARMPSAFPASGRSDP
jgi:hypothetical protein